MSLEAQAEYAAIVRRIEFGLDVENAIGKPIMRYLIAKADAARADALARLAELNPFSQAPQIIEQQVVLKALYLWQDWLAEAVNEGIAAQQQLVESETTQG